MQTELMLRLIKDGKIVGKMNISATHGIGIKGIEADHYSEYCDVMYEADKLPGMEDSTIQCQNVDSFELGIKVGDEWWFEGDIIECTITSDEEVPEQEKFNIPLTHNGFCFFLDRLELSVQLRRLDSAKRIGTIHDEDKK